MQQPNVILRRRSSTIIVVMDWDGLYRRADIIMCNGPVHVYEQFITPIQQIVTRRIRPSVMAAALSILARAVYLGGGLRRNLLAKLIDIGKHLITCDSGFLSICRLALVNAQ